MKLKTIEGFEGSSDYTKGAAAVAARHEGAQIFQLSAAAKAPKPQNPTA